MKKLKNTILILMSCMLFYSCSKCVECASCPEEVTLEQTEICQDDFDSKEEYDEAVAVIRAFGCDCN